MNDIWIALAVAALLAVCEWPFLSALAATLHAVLSSDMIRLGIS